MASERTGGAAVNAARPKAASAIGLIGVTLFTVLLWTAKVTTAAYVGLLTLLAVLCVYICGPNAWTTSRQPAPAGPQDTPRAIAFYLLMFFGTAIGFTGFVAALTSSAQAKEWLEVFKSGFLLLGGGVTTILGYYFGSRQATQAIEAAADAAPIGSGAGPVQGPRPKRPLRRPSTQDPPKSS